MPRPNPQVIRFVRALLAGACAVRRDNAFACTLESGQTVRASVASVGQLVSAGALDGDAQQCRANAVTRNWVKRHILEVDAFATQHRQIVDGGNGLSVNLRESPLAWLAAAPKGAAAYLARHHLEAGERVRQLVDRAHLQPRVTMNYSAAHVSGGKSSPQRSAEISDLASEARRQLTEIHTLLPADCAGVVIDVCGMLKGLQLVEHERGWPRRSAKLVLRIGLDQLARHFGFGPFAVGPAAGRARHWMGENARPLRFE